MIGKVLTLLNFEINETLVFCDIFVNFTHLTRIAKVFTVRSPLEDTLL